MELYRYEDIKEKMIPFSFSCQKWISEVDLCTRVKPVEAIPKDEVIAMLKELQLEIKELWDNRYDVWLDNQYYIGKSDTLGEVDEVIQQKIDKLKECEDGINKKTKDSTFSNDEVLCNR